MTAENANHGHGWSPIGDALEREWHHGLDSAAARIGHLLHAQPQDPAVIAAQTDYEQMVRSRCHAADSCVMDPACPFIGTCTEAESRAPAAGPVNLQTTAPEGTDMSVAADVENGYAAVKDEFAKFEQSLPNLIADAKKLEGSPIGDLAVKAAELVAQGLIPGESLASIARIAGTALEEIVTTFNPPQAAQAAPAATAQ